MREKEFGIWRAFTWARVAQRTRDIALGLQRARARRRATCGADRRQPAGLGDGRDRRACARRTLARHLSRRAGRRGRLPAGLQPARRLVIAEDEEQVDKLLNVPTRCRACATSSTATRAACASTTTRAWCLDGRPAAARRGGGSGRTRGLCDALVDATRRRGRRHPLHHLGHDGAAEARACCTARRADPPLRGLPRGRSEGAAGRIRLGPAAALDHGADLRPRLGR